MGWEDPALAEADVLEHLDQLREAYPVDPDRVVVAGMSQGGGVAIRLALSGAFPCQG